MKAPPTTLTRTSGPGVFRALGRSGARRRLLGALALVAATVPASSLLAACGDDPAGAAPAAPVEAGTEEASTDGGSNLLELQILAINDFHGNLAPPLGPAGTLVARADDPALTGHDAGPVSDVGGGAIAVRAGGAALLAARIKALRAENPKTVVVSAGDLSGGSPLVSGLFHDEPSVLAMNALGLDLNGVGNHEFDRGAAELLRLQNGGCHPVDGCTKGQPAFPGATFHYLAANVNTAMNQTLFRPYEIKTFEGEKVAFIGVTLEQTPLTTTASAVQGLTFGNEATSVNALLPELKAQGVAGIVVLVHQGLVQARGSTYDTCGVDSATVDDWRQQFDPAVDVIVSAHSHQPYVCDSSGTLVTSAASLGRLITKIDLTIDKATHRITKKSAKNLPVLSDTPPDPDVTAIVSTYEALSAPIANRVIGHSTEDILRTPVDIVIGESPLGDLIADAQLEATSGAGGPGAVAAFMNPGGVRTDLLFAHGGSHPDGEITYAEAFAVQPFSNVLVTLTLTGAQIKEVLETGLLYVSSTVTYTVNPAAVFGSRIDPAKVFINGVALDLAASYRVTANNFLTGGGDGFKTFTKGTNPVNSVVDLDALVAYLAAHDPVVKPVGGRIKKAP